MWVKNLLRSRSVFRSAEGKRQKLREMPQDGTNPHDREFREVSMQVHPGGTHFGTAVADAVQVRSPVTQRGHQIGTVQIAAGLANGKKNFHVVCWDFGVREGFWGGL